MGCQFIELTAHFQCYRRVIRLGLATAGCEMLSCYTYTAPHGVMAPFNAW